LARASASLDRRSFLQSSAAALSLAALPRSIAAAAHSASAAQIEIAEIALDLNRIHKWDNSNGDTWDIFWADDDNVYAFNCDGKGFGQEYMNLALNKLSGATPDALVGEPINPMHEYGKGGEKKADNATWKACGQECIDGIFYAFVSRNTYGNDSGDPLTRQTAVNSSLIQSADRGRTWTRTAQENYDRPMWPGASFGSPFFVHYGKNGGQVQQDNAMQYVYACSNNGFWNDGDNLILARVPRAKLALSNGADWEYLSAPDGSMPSSWSQSTDRAIPILDRPARCGQTPITYIPDLGHYLLISWYNTETMTHWFEPNRMHYDFYQAPHPWGPWTLVNSVDDSFLPLGWHFYGPSISAAFQQRNHDEVELSLFTSGIPFEGEALSAYKLWRIPLIVRTRPLPSFRFLPATSPEIHYKDLWYPWTTAVQQAPEILPRAAQSKGASAQLEFTGTGIAYIAYKTIGLGEVDIFLDGEHRATLSLEVTDFPILLDVTLFSAQNLPHRKHTIQLICHSDARINLAGFRIYG
jgi:hypothetical protein